VVDHDSDWKRQEEHTLDWIVVVSALLLAAMDLYLWSVDGVVQYAVLALVVLAWLAVYFTSYWHPILYLLMGLIVTAVILFWLVAAVWDRPAGLLALLLKVGFLFLLGYQFYAEEESLGPIPDR
jgi:hypothetical protein